MKKLFIISIICIDFFAIASGQNVLRGRVTDDDHSPLPGAFVYFIDLNKGTASDSAGFYLVSGIPDGKFRVQYSMIGYSSEVRTVFFDGSPVEVDVALAFTAIETKEVVITGGYNATQHENAVNIDVLKMNGNTNIVTPNTTEMLTRIPGVGMVSKGPGVAKPIIRGLGMDNVLVLNNGVRNENYQYSDHHPMGIDEFGIGEVEIIKGPASLLYGPDAIGGVVNFIPERPAPVGSILGNFNIQLFSNTMGLSTDVGIRGSSKKFFGGFVYGLKTNEDFLQGGGEFVPNSRFNTMSLKLNGGMTGKQAVSQLYYEFNRQKLGLSEQEAVDAIDSRGRRNEIWYEQVDNNLISSRNKFFLDKYKLELNGAFQSAELRHYAGMDTTEINMRLNTLSYEAKLYLPSREGSEYIVGIQGFNQGNVNISGAEEVLLPNGHMANYGVFTLLQYTFFHGFKAQAGLRYDHKIISTVDIGTPADIDYRPALNRDFGSFSGAVGATYELKDKLFFRANFAAAYRNPNLAELTSNGMHETRYEVGDPDLVPQRAAETDFSFHYHAENLTLDIAAFYNRINNYIYINPTGDTVPDGAPVYKYTQENAFLYGGEAGVHFHPQSLEWLHLEGTFSSVTGKKKEGGYLPFIPANQLNFEVKLQKDELWSLKDAFFSINSFTALDQDHPSIDEPATPGYTLFDASIGTFFDFKNSSIALELSVNNIFDKKYIDHLSTLNEVNYFDPGRNITLSLSIPFTVR